MLITRQQHLDTFCEELRQAPPIGFDTEFIRERRYWPQLCLVQVCAGDGRLLALIDPFTIEIKPLLDLVADENLVKIVHAGGQDLQIFFQMFGCTPRRVFDTQIAAAFLGYGHQIGYTDLVQRALGGPALSKGSQYTDWATRPLSAEQTEYALADVRYLPALYARLKDALEARGRLAWAETEFRRAEARACLEIPPGEVYQKLGASGLSRRQLGTLRELAAARDSLAQAADRPPSFIVSDASLIQMAKQPPATIAAMRGIRGINSLGTDHATELLEAIHRAAGSPPEQYPTTSAGERPGPEASVVASLLSLVAQARAAEHEISKSYLAPGDQITELAQWWVRHPEQAPPDIPLLRDWRRELLGSELLQLRCTPAHRR
ncbi:MAG: ribonuclease D [Chloroflexi bacterium]|nr:ribonuclease D [Chloroflexota bacterium]